MNKYFYQGGYGSREEETIGYYHLQTLEADSPETFFIEKIGGVRGLRNPSWILPDEERNMLYAVEEEDDGGSLTVLDIGDRLHPFVRKTVSTYGASPCHLSFDEERRYIFIANYMSGCVTVYRLDAEGLPETMTCHVIHEGFGPVADRQEGAHAHFSIYKAGRLYVCDLGIDRIVIYDFDRDKGLLTFGGQDIILPAGSGPRHMVFGRKNVDIIYVLCELSYDVIVLKYLGGSYSMVQCINALSPGKAVDNTGAAIRISSDGELLFASNRGADTISVFAVGMDGLLSFVEETDCGAKSPRDFVLIDGEEGEGGKGYILCGGQLSDNISLLSYDNKGHISDSGCRAYAHTPTAIALLAKQ